ncbi:MAG: hypothetical protein Q7S10_00680 [bacterium]|nr:hypothetical protein [bacterium]
MKNIIMMSKNFLFALLIAAVLFAGFPLHAVKAASNQEMINSLIRQIAILQAQLAELQAQQNGTPPWCYTFNTNFGVGAAGTNVDAVIIALEKEGITQFNVANLPARYNETIAEAVVKLQAKYGIMQTGYVGPLTRAKLNSFYRCPPAPVALAPTVSLTADNQHGPMVMVQSGTYVNLAWTSVNTTSCNISNMPAPIPALPENNYLTSFNVSLPVAADTTFTVTCLTGLSGGPMTVSNSITVVVSNSQPSLTLISPNGGETYKKEGPVTVIPVNWKTTGIMPLETIDVIRLRSYTSGQEYNLAYTVVNDGNEVIFVPSSVPAGSYTLEMKTYKNNVLVFDASDSYFKIIDAAQPVINLISPNGGEVWKFGETRRISWTSQGLDKVAIYVYNDTVSGSGSTNYLDSAGTSLSVSASQGYFDWTIAQNWLPKTTAGNENRYKIVISGVNVHGTMTRDSSENYFSIIAPAPATQPSVTVVLPNGSEVFMKNHTYTIAWNYANLLAGAYVHLLLVNHQNGSQQDIIAYVPAALGTYSWTVNTFMPPGSKFKVGISYNAAAASYTYDESDNYFTIINP